jgi:hypothetical protein
MAGVLKVSNMIWVIFFTIGLWVEGGFGQENGVFFRSNTEFIVEGVMPDFLHIIPVGDDSMFNGIFQSEDTSL